MPSSTTNEKRTVVRGLGEIALRVNNLGASGSLRGGHRLAADDRVTNCAFFKIADGYGGHTQVLALSDRSESPGYRGTERQLPQLTTSHSRYLSLILQTNGRD